MSSRILIRSAPEAAGRRFGHPVVLGAEVLVDRHRLEPGRIGILQVLDDPEPAALVEAGRHRLPHHRLGREDLDVKPVGTTIRLTASSGVNPRVRPVVCPL